MPPAAGGFAPKPQNSPPLEIPGYAPGSTTDPLNENRDVSFSNLLQCCITCVILAIVIFDQVIDSIIRFDHLVEYL